MVQCLYHLMVIISKATNICIYRHTDWLCEPQEVILPGEGIHVSQIDVQIDVLLLPQRMRKHSLEIILGSMCHQRITSLSNLCLTLFFSLDVL